VAQRLYLDTRTRPGAKQAAIIERITSGEYAFKGSKIAWHSSERAWYVKLGYQLPKAEPIAADPDRVAYLVPGRDRPWYLWDGGWPKYIGGTGRHVAHVRRQLLTQRWSRQASYRVASSAGKGHGRKRAYESKTEALRHRWLDFVKTANEAMVVDVLAYCRQRGIGRVVYFQPVAAKREKRFLAMAGKVPGKRDATLWDFFQAGKILRDKCTEVGVQVQVRQYGAR
jgi:hypothetical protein